MSGRVRTSAVKLALLGRKLWVQDSDIRNAEPIAIVGMGCRIPGGANSPESLWHLLLEGRDAVGAVPADRWDVDAWFDADPATPGRMSTRWGGFLEDVRGFDAAYFDISAREAERMDPQQRIALEVACEAFERAGIPLDRLRNTLAGVFVASYHNDYALLQYADPDTITARTLTGALQSIVSNRISYLLGLRGPSLTIDSACSSSLVAVHLACQSLRARDCDVALAGGVSVMATPHISIALSKGGFMSPTGRCHTFDAAADGFIRAEGCGMIVLKRLSDAIQSGDHVLAVIRGSAVNQDGESTTLSAPNGLAQEELVRRALHNAGMQPEDISLIEAHGTGTELGDPIETDALDAVFRDRDPAAGPCWLGSLKSNVGHLEAAAGVAGLIKTVLCLQHRTVPRQALFHSLNPHIDLSLGALRIATDTTPWESDDLRAAGVSSFGVGGTNAHVVVEEAPASLKPAGSPVHAPYVLPLSARSAGALRALSSAYAERLRRGIDAGDLCRAAARRRMHYADARVAMVGATGTALVEQLDAVARGERAVAGARSEPVAFVFTGQGSQWPGMARSLIEAEPVFRDALHEAAAVVQAAGGPDVLAEIAASADDSRLERTDVAQAAIFAVQVALVRLLDAWGIRPAAVIGHSIGELAAAVAAGLLDLAPAARAVVERGRVMQATFDAGRMISVRAVETDVRSLLQRHALDLSVAAVNGPTAIVLSGATEEIERAVAVLTAERIEFTRLNVRFAFHSPLMSDAANTLESAVQFPAGAATGVTFISTVSGAPRQSFDCAYLAANVRSTVRFANAVETALDAGVTTFIEIGAHPALGRGITELAEARGLEARVGFCLHRERDHALTLHTLAAQAYTWGIDVDWSGFYPGSAVSVDLPTYAWQHVPYWFPQAPDLAQPGTAPRRGNTSFPGPRLTSPALRDAVYELNLRDPVFQALSDHRINGESRLPATAFAELIRSAAIAAGMPVAEVRGLGILRPVRMGDDRRVQVVLTDGIHADSYNATVHVATGSEWERVATAEVHPSTLAAATESVAINGIAVPTDAFYTLLEEQGCDFGSGFRLLADIVATTDAAVGAIHVDAATAWSGPVHPAHVDAAAQLCIAVLRERGLAGTGGAFLPWSVDAYHVFDTAVPVRGEAVLIDATTDAATFDVTLYAVSGVPIARLKGWRLRFTAVTPSQLRVIEWEAESAPNDAGQRGGPWLVFADPKGLGSQVAEALAARGVNVTLVLPGDAAATIEALDSLHADPTSWRGVMLPVLQDVADPATAIEQVCRPLLDVARHASSHGAAGLNVLIVTRASQVAGALTRDSDAAAAAAWGIARVLRAERPDLSCITLDLDAVPNGSGVSPADVESIVQEMLAPAGSREIAIREGQRLKARTEIDQWKPVHAPAPSGEIRLVHRAAGTLDGFAVETFEPGAPAPGNVRIRVLAAGVNFRDVLTALGSYPGAREFGHECCGIVEDVAPDVWTVAPGERVIAFWPGTFATSVEVPATHVFPAPDGLDPVGAATLPVAFGTAWYALFEIGSIGAGNSVLIHSGAGGVGLAAIQLAQAAGARVFATAGTAARRALLERLGVEKAFDSRSPDFADALLTATGGAGVDLVLNSLIGPMIPAGLKVLHPGGVFVELGKREILSDAEVAEHRTDVRYVAFDLYDEARDDEMLLPRIFTSLNGMLAAKAIQPLPARVFGIDDAEYALRRMSRGEHVGKTVFVLPSRSLRALEGWVVVTGGTGGIGIATLEWLVRRGAVRVALWSRRGAESEAATRIAQLGTKGVDIRVMRVDVAQAEDVQTAFDTLRTEAPITGIIHAAGIVDDAMLADQDWPRFERVLAPKAVGAWNLHAATLHDPLELFLLYSAAGPMVDAKGQANYAAANAYVDALAMHRRARGLPATSVLWGPWRDAGMASRLDVTQQQRWTRHGMDWWTAESALSTLDAVLETMSPQVIAVRLASAGAPRSERVAAVRAVNGLHERLAAADASLRIGMLLDHVRGTLAGLLGMPDGPSPDAPLRDAGLDSLTAIELRNALTLSVGVSLPATLAFDHPTAIAISHFLLATMQLDASTAEVGKAVEPGLEDRIHADVIALTDEEAEAALLEELGLQSGMEA